MELVRLTVDFGVMESITVCCDSTLVGFKEMPCWSQKRVKSSFGGVDKGEVEADKKSLSTWVGQWTLGGGTLRRKL